MASNKVNFPLILVNLKTYKEATGEKAVKFTAVAEAVSKRTGVCICVAPQTVDLRAVIEATETPVFAQHIDPVGYGKYTGYSGDI